MSIDYSSLAKKFGGTTLDVAPIPIDYSALAKKNGGISQSITPIVSPNLSTKNSDKLPQLIDTLGNFSEGFVKSGLNTVQNIGLAVANPINSFFDKITGKINTPIGIPKETLTPQGTGQEVGAGVEKIAEFLLPSGKIASATKVAQGLIKGTNIASRLLKTGIKLGNEVISTGAITAAQQGEVNDQVKTNALVSGLFSLGGSTTSGLIKGTTKAIGKLGEKIQSTVIRPTIADVKDGFKIENLKKYNIGGSNEQVLSKTSNKLNELSTQLNQKLGASTNSVNLNNVYKDTINTLSGNKAKNFGNIQGTERVLEALKNEIAEVAGNNGLVSVPEAQLVKQGAGTKGSWVFGSGEPDASAVEKVYNTFYQHLKTAVEKSSPEGIREINKQISELIPIQNAVLRRIPVEQRNNVMSLTDHISLFGSLFNPKALALLGASRLSKSGRFGNFLVNAADKIKIQPKSAISKRIIGD